MGNARPIDGRSQSEVQVGPDKLEVVAFFCYLADMLSARVGCEIMVTTHVKTAYKKFRQLLPVLTSHHLSFKTRDHDQTDLQYQVRGCGHDRAAMFMLFGKRLHEF